jgi:hypothetical protein
LEGCAEPVRSELLAAIDVATDIDLLEMLRHGQGLTIETTRAIVARTVRALLNDVSPDVAG